ncbi:heme ABC transporter permease [Saccharobesus litoralis]|uniref:Heme exporter protein C n=1 Tax=Saccharobesus litoralis TaxID=2172099 RepID=A0A2S0VT50_9ALTE|nr:heme ABC transporter permease [Saccharobesus litoralis]AWB67398.1 heme ABC transporter permease [Saccharobesus litoralis]
MFKWLHPYAKPEKAYELSNRIYFWVMPFAALCLIIGSIWGLVFAPTDYQQGESYRLIFFHVPAAIWSMGAYTSMGIAGFCALVWQIRTLELAVIAIAPIGAVFTALALATGAIWGKPMWGTWWVWDARLTSELILLFLYIGVFALYFSFDDRRTGGKAACILAVVGIVNVPIIHYSVEWWNTLHQGATISKFEKPSMPAEMLWPLLINILGFFLLFTALTSYRFATELVKSEAHRKWVLKLVRQMAK